MPERRGRPRGSIKMPMLSPADSELLEGLAAVFPKISASLCEAEVHQQFTANVLLLIGMHKWPIYELAKRSGCSQSTLGRAITYHEHFKKMKPATLICIAAALGVSVNTLLFVDLSAELRKVISELEHPEK